MTMSHLPQIAGRIFNTPLLIHPQKLDAMIAGLGGRLLGVPSSRIQHAGEAAQAVLAPELFSTRRGERAERGYRIVDGVAVLSVSGVLVHRSRLDMAESTFFYGYNDLAADLEDAMANPEVHAVLLVYDSPGGEAQGAFEYAQRVHAMRGRKPLWAISDGMAASAAYLGGSAAEQFAITSTGIAGSIGVVARHVDLSRALDAEGITVTHIFAGSHKVDGNPYEPLPESVRKDWQAEIDNLYGMFIDAVATHRGIDVRAVRATQAATYTGQAAVDARLADRIATTDSLIAELAALRARSYPAGPTARTTAEKGATMSGNTPGGQQAATTTAAPAAQFTQADLDTARAEGATQGAKAERERTSAILTHEAAQGRTDLAIQCVTSGLSADQAAAILGAAPKAPAAQAGAGNQFAQHMAALGNPKITGTEPSQEEAGPAAIAASWDMAFGIQPGRA
ncbi:peptidase S49 [Alicycliphilus denitrificans BC]|nr:peptidase S49 [Alicycliphilus denitrificans BC]